VTDEVDKGVLIDIIVIFAAESKLHYEGRTSTWPKRKFASGITDKDSGLELNGIKYWIIYFLFL
jgi:hypothetical protein